MAIGTAATANSGKFHGSVQLPLPQPRPYAVWQSRRRPKLAPTKAGAETRPKPVPVLNGRRLAALRDQPSSWLSIVAETAAHDVFLSFRRDPIPIWDGGARATGPKRPAADAMAEKATAAPPSQILHLSMHATQLRCQAKGPNRKIHAD
jgi:hypothetical protein